MEDQRNRQHDCARRTSTYRPRDFEDVARLLSLHASASRAQFLSQSDRAHRLMVSFWGEEMNYGDIALLGIDVGFSRSRPTTGVAWSANGTFGAAKTHADWDRRRQHLPAATTYSVVAIDGPMVPAGSPDLLVRTCEQTLARGAFQKRCKPGSSHFGTGLQLKRLRSKPRNRSSI